MASEAYEMYALFQSQAQGAFNPKAIQPGWFPFKLLDKAGLTISPKHKFHRANPPALAIHIPLSACKVAAVRSLVRANMIRANLNYSHVRFRLVNVGSGCNGKVLDDLELSGVNIKAMAPWVTGTEVVIRLTYDAQQIHFNQ